jgi:hypothetical protein
VTAVSKARPQVIDDKEHERVHERVAAVDVAKDTGMVCTRLPHPSRPGARQSTVWTVKARMGTIRALGHQLARDGIEAVTLEATSDYWRIWLRREASCCIPGLASIHRVNSDVALLRLPWLVMIWMVFRGAAFPPLTCSAACPVLRLGTGTGGGRGGRGVR